MIENESEDGIAINHIWNTTNGKQAAAQTAAETHFYTQRVG